MRSRPWRAAFATALCSALVGGLIALAAADETRSSKSVAPRVLEPALARGAAPDELDGFALLKRARVEGDKYYSKLDSGERVELTLSPKLQAHVQEVFARYAVPAGAFVAIEPKTGRVLAYVSHGTGDRVLDSSPPAASVFKLITSSALLDAGVSPDTRTCYGGGASSISAIDIQDNPRRDRSCVTLSQALGSSTNAVFAKLAVRKLEPAGLNRYAKAFGFGQPLPGELRATAGPCDVPDQQLEFARTAAGFWHSRMSPLHGALIAATFANAGIMPSAGMIERVLETDGRVRYARGGAAHPGRRVLEASTARAVGRMMLRTVKEGTSREAFRDPRGRPYMEGIEVAGKTGSLSSGDPYRAYSWWVGFAPADQPQVALAALVINSDKWRIKSSFVARDALEQFLPAWRCTQLAGPTSDRRCAKTQRR
ncbi:MAG TPA: penicillin-binding transpeptidase domain-containing protein [Polyangiales bacterium]|nr:penicillin-binding transpeptidase domain-containing protein [Polyangiales bacterium]